MVSKRKIWTDEEAQKLEKFCREKCTSWGQLKATYKEILPGRSWGSVKGKAKDNEAWVQHFIVGWSDEEEAKLERHCKEKCTSLSSLKETFKTILPKRTWKSVRHKIYENKDWIEHFVSEKKDTKYPDVPLEVQAVGYKIKKVLDKGPSTVAGLSTQFDVSKWKLF